MVSNTARFTELRRLAKALKVQHVKKVSRRRTISRLSSNANKILESLNEQERQFAEGLFSQSESERSDSIKSLLGLRCKKAVPLIRNLLRDNRIGLRIKSIIALAKMGDRPSIPLIEKRLLLDTDLGVKCCAMEALVFLGSKPSIPLIRRMVGHKSAYLCERAILALADLGDLEVIKQVEKLEYRKYKLLEDRARIKKAVENASAKLTSQPNHKKRLLKWFIDGAYEKLFWDS